MKDCPFYDECAFDADARGYDLICDDCDIYLYQDEEVNQDVKFAQNDRTQNAVQEHEREAEETETRNAQEVST